ncbi:EGFR-like transmembrane domain-containing protein [Aspergillus melleus]|uniref:EGFR-like transmembrane domain-containing protein n=1 Tax=Aspergillus melleus TaxID=138277 RepID=UPI001E8EBF03|nr:uncharacterized protein LDX57_002219 [Aspergillus melleus]KAH8424468.1 hypothetical protein LDX57_002219 [Aspergillus melleus]
MELNFHRSPTLIYTLFSILSPVSGWAFGWTNSSGNTQFESGTETEYRSCTRIHQAKGKLFDWDSEEQPICWQIYRDVNCKDSGGHACHMLSKNASDDFAAFSVYPRDSSVTATSALATSTLSTATTPTSGRSSITSNSLATSSTTKKAAESSKPLSGGAIAGVVIGVLFGVAIVAVLICFLVKRRKVSPTEGEPIKPRLKAPSVTSQVPEPYVDPTSSRTSPRTSPAIPSTQPTAELQGDSAPMEMSDSHRVVELETPGTIKGLYH